MIPADAQAFLDRNLKVSHERQFNGEDWQLVANEIMEKALLDHEDCVREEVYNELCASPDPGCECGFCATAGWKP